MKDPAYKPVPTIGGRFGVICITPTLSFLEDIQHLINKLELDVQGEVITGVPGGIATKALFGESPMFDELTPGDALPQYDVLLTRDEVHPGLGFVEPSVRVHNGGPYLGRIPAGRMPMELVQLGSHMTPEVGFNGYPEDESKPVVTVPDWAGEIVSMAVHGNGLYVVCQRAVFHARLDRNDPLVLRQMHWELT